MTGIIRQHDENYTGRTTDLEVLSGVSAPVGTYELALSVIGSGKFITGLQKMAQRYALTLLTELGSVYRDDQQGTDFWGGVVRGMLRDAGTMAAEFSFASVKAVRDMQDEDSRYPGTPDDERIASARLVNIEVNINAASALFVVELRSVSGDTHVYKVPVSVVEAK